MIAESSALVVEGGPCPEGAPHSSHSYAVCAQITRVGTNADGGQMDSLFWGDDKHTHMRVI